MTEDQQVCGTLSHVAVRSGYYQTTFFLTISRLLRPPPLLVVVLIWIFLPAAIGSSFSYHYQVRQFCILHHTYPATAGRLFVMRFYLALAFGVGFSRSWTPEEDSPTQQPPPSTLLTRSPRAF